MMNTTSTTEPLLHRIKAVCRIALGLVWLYEGLVPKILFLHANPHQTSLVERWGIWLGSPEATLAVLGVAQAALGLVLIFGWKERAAVALATLWMAGLMVLVGGGMPSMLYDPFGALAKDLCLIACALVVWWLAPLAGEASRVSRAPRSG